MRARPVLTVKLDSALPLVAVAPLEGSSVAIVRLRWDGYDDLRGELRTCDTTL
jgi:hypothetical protein